MGFSNVTVGTHRTGYYLAATLANSPLVNSGSIGHVVEDAQTSDHRQR
jgi:hypothetical protein